MLHLYFLSINKLVQDSKLLEITEGYIVINACVIFILEWVVQVTFFPLFILFHLTFINTFWGCLFLAQILKHK